MLSGLTNLKNRVFDILSFSYPKYRFFTIIVILFLMFIIPLQTLESLPNLSICNHFLGKYCYSVGITRGVSSILKGNLSLALAYNPLSFFVLGMLILILINDSINLFCKKPISQNLI